MDLLPAGWRTSHFSPDGQYLASGGEDGVVCIWRVTSADASYKDLMVEGNSGIKVKGGKSAFGGIKTSHASILIPDKVFHIEESPLQEFYGHSSDVLDLSWSNSNCLLSSSMDKTVRLWQKSQDTISITDDESGGCSDIDDVETEANQMGAEVNSLRKKRIYCRLGCMCKNGGEDALKCSTQGRANNGRKGLRDGVGGSVGDLFCLAGSFIFAVQQMDWVRSGFFGRKKCWILIFTRNFLRRELWKNLECFRNSVGQSPWLIVGDFNVVKSPCEKLGGNVSGYENDFLQCLNSLEIDDYPAGILVYVAGNRSRGDVKAWVKNTILYSAVSEALAVSTLEFVLDMDWAASRL
uniref:Endonuclease/exonuclease/phosphatase domain-containing protein n=1 Tax=Fagus sylvatica TaxID=28930 RepID=A0A2N9FXT5_FAGSY